MQDDSQERSRFRNLSQNAEKTQTVYHPGVAIQSPATMKEDLDTSKIGMLFSIIGGVIALAIAIGQFMTSELDSDMEFLYLASGAFLLVLVSYGFVEIQYRRHKQISIVHDYVLSFGHLFAVLGGFWLSRWALYFYCGYFPDDGIMCHGKSGGSGWIPGEWGILAQATIFALLGFSQWLHNDRVKATILPRMVTVLSPLVILLIGAEIWVGWADGVISLPLILSIIGLTGMGMWLGSTSNRAPLFLSSAFLSSFIPILYEFSVGGGAGLSLLVLIVLMQGVFASAKGLSRSMIQHGSIGLVLMVLIAELWAVSEDLNIVIVNTIDNSIISLPLLIWLSLLVGYFIPVHMRRVPWMPIGLAVGLIFLPSPGSAIAWSLAIIAFVYMLNVPKTRRWVADWTYIMLATSWFIIDLLSWIGDPFEVLALDSNFLIVPPAALLVLGYVGSQYNRISSAPYHLAVLLILFSHEMLFGTNTWLPLLFVIYLISLVLREATNANNIDSDDTESRKNVSVLVLVTGFSIFILEWMNRLDTGLGELIGVSELGVEALILAVALYALGRNLRNIEYDIGWMGSNLTKSVIRVSDWNPNTREWTSKTSKFEPICLGAAMRGSMIFPLLIFSLSAAAGTETWVVLLLLMPIIVLMREILFELPSDNKTRAAGIWLLFFVGLPWSFRIHESLISGGGDSVVMAQIVFDLIMLSGPLLGHMMLIRQGVDYEEGNASDWILYGVMAVALLDVSGGILLISMLLLVIIRGIQHRRPRPLSILPFVWAFGALLLISLPATIIESGPQIDALLESRSSLFLGIEYPAWVGLGWIVAGLPVLLLYLRDTMNSKSEEVESNFPVIVPSISVIAGLHLLIPGPHLLLLAAVIFAGFAAYYGGKLVIFWLWPLMFLISLNYSASEEGWFGSDIGQEVYTISSLVTWLITILYWKGIIQSRAGEVKDPEDNQFAFLPQYFVKVETTSSRTALGNVLLIQAAIFSLIGWESSYGLVFLATTIIMSYRFWLQRYGKMMLGMAFFEALAIGNTALLLFEKYEFEAMGSWLVLSGLIMTWASWRNWDWEWQEESDETIIKLSNNSGIFGAIFVPIGALMLSDDTGIWMFGAVLSVFGGIQMMIGFEQDERWRRIYTLIAIPIGILIVASDISNGVLQGVMYLLAALTLFGQGFLYMSRAGLQVSGTSEESGLVAEGMVAPPSASPSTAEPLEIPEPVLSQEEEEVQSEPTPPEIIPPVPQRFDSGEGFDVELPLDVRSRIGLALQGTNYEGFRPVVKWDSYGRVILDFEPMNE